MDESQKQLFNISEEEVLEMVNETSELLVKHNVNQLSSAVIAAQGSNALSNNVEFWKWMGRNYKGAGIFDSNATMLQYISDGLGKEQWLVKQLQGKGYEWDWMSKQRENIKNIFNTYDAGDIANRAASDVTQKNIINGRSREYQMKAYTSKSNPHLKNTPKDMTVVTNIEKTDVVKANGYNSVEEFQNTQMIKQSTEDRLEQIRNGKVQTSYNFKNVAGTMAKAGLVGCAIGLGTEAVLSYKDWKQGRLSNEEYLKEILKSGGDAGVTAAATSGIMIPVAAVITVMGTSTLLTIPVAFIVGDVVNKVVAPCFGRGKYREILSKMKYYQNLQSVYDDLIISMEYASEQYYNFAKNMAQQKKNNEELKKCSTDINKELKDLFESI